MITFLRLLSAASYHLSKLACYYRHIVTYHLSALTVAYLYSIAFLHSLSVSFTSSWLELGSCFVLFVCWLQGLLPANFFCAPHSFPSTAVILQQWWDACVRACMFVCVGVGVCGCVCVCVNACVCDCARPGVWALPRVKRFGTSTRCHFIKPSVNVTSWLVCK